MLLQYSSLQVMKEWISVSAAEDERVGRLRAMLQRWKKDVFLTLFMCALKESVGSIMMLRYRYSGCHSHIVAESCTLGLLTYCKDTDGKIQ